MNQSSANHAHAAAPVNRAPPRPLGDNSLIVFATALAVYAGCAFALGHRGPGSTPYFAHLADAFLHGRLDLVEPATTYDLTPHEGRWYVPFPPLPALLMLPWVALMGLGATNALVLSLLAGALNVALVSRILDRMTARGWIWIAARQRRWLVLLFALGCVHWHLALEGAVWFLAQVCTLTFILLAVERTLAGASPLAGSAALAIALLGRPNVIFTSPLLLAIHAQRLRDARDGPIAARLWRFAAASALPLVISISMLAGYNYARFDNPLDFGYADQQVATDVRGDLLRYGQFNVRYVLRNLYVMLLAGPSRPHAWALPVPDEHGMSLILTFPALLYLVRLRRLNTLAVGALAALALLLVPLLLYYNTGWKQFGYRFSLDFLTPLMVLLALAAGTRVTRPLRVLIVLGIIANAWGVLWWYTDWLA